MLLETSDPSCIASSSPGRWRPATATGCATVAAAKIIPSRRLEIGGQLGFQAFYAGREDRSLDTAASRARGVAEGRAASAMIIAYAAEMDADPGLLARALIRPPEDMTYIIRVREFVALNVCPIGLTARGRPWPSRPQISAAMQRRDCWCSGRT